MRTRPKRASRWAHQPDISLTAFLDLILNILLFFVFATELAVLDALDVAVPTAEYSDTLSTRRDTLTIVITRDNQYMVDGVAVPLEQLSTAISQKRSEDETLGTIIVRGDLNSRLQATVDALSACRVAGIEKVKLETEKPVKPPNS